MTHALERVGRLIVGKYSVPTASLFHLHVVTAHSISIKAEEVVVLVHDLSVNTGVTPVDLHNILADVEHVGLFCGEKMKHHTSQFTLCQVLVLQVTIRQTS